MTRESQATRAARLRLADEVAAEGPGYANAAASIRAGVWGNVWTAAAIRAIEATNRNPLDTEDD